jgi:hypothetical protein
VTIGRGIALASAATLLHACATAGGSPHPNLATVWSGYSALSAERALAIAGDPRRDRWVAGVAGGHASRSEAEAEALTECRRRRAARRLQAACALYAVGSEIVWSGP